MQWETMTEREKNAAIAEKVMGYHREVDNSYDYHHIQHKNEVLLPSGQTFETLGRSGYTLPPSGSIPFAFFVSERYTTDRNAFALVEQELERRDRLDEYMNHLLGIDGDYTYEPLSLRQAANLITAPLDMRCRAALRACGMEV